MFVVGLVILFKGGFRLGSRVISFAQSRTLAMMLMAPLVLAVCANLVLFLNNSDVLMSMVDESGEVNFDAAAFNNILNYASSIELALVIGALVLVGFTLYNAPKDINIPPVQPHPRQGGAPASVPLKAPDIMTVAEAAAYMRLSESEVLTLIEEGRLGAAKIGNSFRIARIAIDDFMGRT